MVASRVRGFFCRSESRVRCCSSFMQFGGAVSIIHNLKGNLVNANAELTATKSQLEQVTRERDRALAQVAELQAQLSAATAAASRSKDEASQALLSTQANLVRRESELRSLGEKNARLEQDGELLRTEAAALRGQSAALQRDVEELTAQVRKQAVTACVSGGSGHQSREIPTRYTPPMKSPCPPSRPLSTHAQLEQARSEAAASEAAAAAARREAVAARERAETVLRNSDAASAQRTATFKMLQESNASLQVRAGLHADGIGLSFLYGMCSPLVLYCVHRRLRRLTRLR
jgi:multidrug efflux pump subunit AcrA (membrane-fusion protein)